MLKLNALLVVQGFLLVLLVCIVPGAIAFASPENWVEITRFTGVGSVLPRTTTEFTVVHVNWRIRWQFTYDTENPNGAGLVAEAFPQGSNSSWVSFIFSIGGSPTSGTSYITNSSGIFYMLIIAGESITAYTFIVEQDSDSPVPEFSPAILILLLFALASASALLGKKRIN